MFRTIASTPSMLAADSHIRRPRPLDMAIQREQSLVLNMSVRVKPCAILAPGGYHDARKRVKPQVL
jgi:hypothetical protein